VDTSAEDSGNGAERREPLGADLIVPGLAAALTLYYLATTADLVWEARATGLFVGVALLALCAVQFVRLGRRILSGQGSLSLGALIANNIDNRRRLVLLLLVASFIATIGSLGTTLGLFLLLVGSMLAMGVRDVRALLAVSIAASSAVYVLLILILDTRLPQGPLEKLLAATLGPWA
jgi:hypothetical protein